MNPSVDRIGVLTTLLGVRFPLVQAGMGGVAGPRLAAAVSEAGAAGVVALYRMRPPQIAAATCATSALTARSFGVNIIPELVGAAELAAQIDTVLHETDARVFFTSFGLPGEAMGARIREAGRHLMVMVGSIEDAHRAAAQGATLVVLQGTEAGGHLLGTQPLDALVDDAIIAECPVPFLCAGGIADGHRFRELVARGAVGCLCGTVFVATAESMAHPTYKQRLVDASAEDTRVTDLFDGGWPGRRHRVLRNPLTDLPQRLPRRFIGGLPIEGRHHPIARYSAMVPTATTDGSIDEMVMYGGTSVDGVISVPPAAERVHAFIQQFAANPAQAGQRGSASGASTREWPWQANARP